MATDQRDPLYCLSEDELEEMAREYPRLQLTGYGDHWEVEACCPDACEPITLAASNDKVRALCCLIKIGYAIKDLEGE